MKFYKQFVLVMSLKNGVCSLKVHIFNMIVENIALSLISSHISYASRRIGRK